MSRSNKDSTTTTDYKETQRFEDMTIFDYYNFISNQAGDDIGDLEMSAFVNAGINDAKNIIPPTLIPKYMPFGDAASLEVLPEEEKLLTFYGNTTVMMTVVLQCALVKIHENNDDVDLMQIAMSNANAASYQVTHINPETNIEQEVYLMPDLEDMQDYFDPTV